MPPKPKPTKKNNKGLIDAIEWLKKNKWANETLDEVMDIIEIETTSSRQVDIGTYPLAPCLITWMVKHNLGNMG